MDPISIIASIIAVIQLSGKVISLCYDYRTGVKSAPKDATRITDEITSLCHVLEQLLKIAEAEEATHTSRLPALQSLARPEGALQRSNNPPHPPMLISTEVSRTPPTNTS